MSVRFTPRLHLKLIIMNKLCYPILLPTKNILDNGNQIHRNTTMNRDLLILPITGAEGRRLRASTMQIKPQHLYICSDEEIKEGDWCINLSSGSVFKIIKIIDSKNYKVEFLTGGNISSTISTEDWSMANPKKIIATTDSSLVVTIPKGADYESNTELPTIPQEFIQLYIKRYNEGRKIEKCIIEYEEVLKWENALVGINKNIPMSYGPFVREQLKLNGNEIIIHEIENKLFPLSVVKAAYAEGINKGRFGFDELPTPRLHFDNWIKQHI